MEMKSTANKKIGNKGLRDAKQNKNDEFYTQLDDIASELKYYKSQFAGKTVLCNCDDPYESDFFKFFALVFNEWGLKKLICTCWNGSPIVQKELLLFDDAPEDEDGRSRVAYKIELTEVKDLNGDGATDLEDVKLLLEDNKPQRLIGNGDFRCEECIEFLKEADIVVTNPPFSLFREYVSQLIEYDKKFVIIGSKNAIKYKEIFPLIRDNKLWTGHRSFSGGMWFKSSYEGKTEKVVDGEKLINVPAIWFTNLDHKKRHDFFDLYKHYSPEEYPKYENFDAINVDETTDIPMDYDGVMGVPITFLDKYCPEQFEIIGVGIAGLGLQAGVQPYKPEHKKYRKEVQRRGAVDGDLYMMVNGEVFVPYSRILIRRK